MANYESVTRSNYFHVKDEDAMEVFMEFRTELKIMILTFFFPNFRSTLLPKMRSSL